MSKGLEALEELKKDLTPMNFSRIEKLDRYKVIEKALKDKEKELKALEIIKKKKVNVGDFVRCKSVEDYNEYCCYGKEETLTQEEYDLLKEELL